jgi:L-ascorbate metabolism protein UlaG (beta-lactamase superfamily)
MELIKHAHACVTVRDNDRRLLIDPGTFTPDASALLDTASAVLITHEHFDHFDVASIVAALEARDDLTLWGPEGATASLAETRAAREGRVITVAGGERILAAGFSVDVVGGDHASIHDGIPVPRNVAYLIEGVVYHPGDSRLLPRAAVDTLLVPSSGPWVNTRDAIDFIRAVAPRRTVQIHDIMLSEIGRGSTGMFLGETGLTGIPMVILEPGSSITL